MESRPLARHHGKEKSSRQGSRATYNHSQYLPAPGICLTCKGQLHSPSEAPLLESKGWSYGSKYDPTSSGPS